MDRPVQLFRLNNTTYSMDNEELKGNVGIPSSVKNVSEGFNLGRILGSVLYNNFFN